MSKFGFGENFIKWIWACISEPWIAPLVNGRATDFFKASRGLRHGFPLSPILFVIQASFLSFLLNKKMQDQDINGLCIARGVKNINHALFTDDTLLLGPATLTFASKFKVVLDDFRKASGSSINKRKFHIYSWNITPKVLSDISRCLGFSKRPTSKDWLPQLEKFKSKIQAWGYSWLNTAGKSVVIKSVLISLPLFQFTGFLAPVTIIKKWKNIFRGSSRREEKKTKIRFLLSAGKPLPSLCGRVA